MCDSEAAATNLIDLNFDEECQKTNFQDCDKILEETKTKQPSNNNANEQNIAAPAAAAVDLLTNNLQLSLIPIPENVDRRDSFGNNPFDTVQKLTKYMKDDPFGLISKETTGCKRNYDNQLKCEVKVANLLKLSNENLLDDDGFDDAVQEMYENSSASAQEFTKQQQQTSPVAISDCCHKETNISTASPSVYYSAIAKDLEYESPPVNLMSLTPVSYSSSSGQTNVGDSADGSSGSGSGSVASGASAKTKRAEEIRKRLLKLSISNSTFNSPNGRQKCPLRTESGSIEGEIISPISAIFNAAINSTDQLLSAESPLKLVEDDDLMAGELSFQDSEKDFEADLKMLRIPMLEKLPPPTTQTVSAIWPNDLNESTSSNDVASAGCKSLPNLDALRAKLRAKQDESRINQDISSLIQNLKAIIGDNTAVVSDKKRQEAYSLLEALSSTLANANDAADKVKAETPVKTESADSSQNSVITPQPIVRQGTFDIELQENEDDDPAKQNLSDVTHSVHATNSVDTAQEIPDIMFKSSATYDGESAADKVGFILPVVDDIATTKSLTPSPPSTRNISPEQSVVVQDIVEQISRLLEQHCISHETNLNAATNAITSSALGTSMTGSAALNPTFIVVMNTSQIAADTTATGVHSGSSTSSDSNQLTDNNQFESYSDMRRRSQSLSIHDKVKVLHLPLQQPIAAAAAQQQSPLSTSSSQVSPIDLPGTTDGSEFKTPARMIPRRNSFSSATPYTPINKNLYVGVNGTRAESVMRNQRPLGLLRTHYERQQNSETGTARPLAQVNNLKPDFKKRHKTNESIMKSKGPLKATIPFKTVAPMVKISPPLLADDYNETPTLRNASGNLNPNTYIHLLTNSNTTSSKRLSHISTPRPPTKFSNGMANITTGFPNACSTPAPASTQLRSSVCGSNTPIRRSINSNTNAMRSRYSMSDKQNSISTTTGMNSVESNSSAATNTSSSSSSLSSLRRRTTTDFKAKSPMKSRSSISTGIGRIGAVGRASMSKISTNVGKALTQSVTTNTGNTARLSNRLSSASSINRAAAAATSNYGSSSSTTSGISVGIKRNKENKLP